VKHTIFKWDVMFVMKIQAVTYSPTQLISEMRVRK